MRFQLYRREELDTGASGTSTPLLSRRQESAED
jgi:hypothetical protein